MRVVAAIIDDVRARGDAALIEQTKRFDRLELTPATLARDRRRDRRGGDSMRAGGARGAALRRGADRGLSPHASCPPISTTPTRRACGSARAIGRSARSGSMCRAARRPIRRRC